MDNTLRLQDGRRVEIRHLAPYGYYVAKNSTSEPDALPYEALEQLKPDENLPKIPRALFLKLSKFFYDYASKNLEVHARVMYNPKTNQHQVWVPQQSIAGYSVDRFDYSVAVNLETGDLVGLQQRDWVRLWQFHVHPFNMPGPSSIDDNGFFNQPGTGELDFPSGYGIFSCWRSEGGKEVFTLRCNVVVHDGNLTNKNKRLSIPTSCVVEGIIDGETIPVYKAQYSELAHSVVKRYTPPVVSKGVKGSSQFVYPHYQDFSYYLPAISKETLEETIARLVIEHGKQRLLYIIKIVEE